ncbi:uncharacterized protein N7498_008386 [Penicillium cinerascens]|uniref:Uncharacterized protein n=1 Tax=Penicillium cinerascens TaxID=70096 RepID=A0A9W9MAL7_9EURO|nr:uncharacterized protein N7498_008386 [Penicillium cinerascens]KAJ5194948.1 hypothetical protein N7498_008386 [Penicillium cinerascens]
MAFKIFGLGFLRDWKRKHPAETQRKQSPNKWQALQLESENIELRRNLQEATATIDAQERQLAEYDFLLAHSQVREIDSTVRSFRPDMNRSPMPIKVLNPRSNPTSSWIQDIWLCIDHDIKCLKDAERHWKNGNPASALQYVKSCVDDGSNSIDSLIRPCEEMRCRAFIAAVLHSFEKYEDSNQRVDAILQIIANGYMHGRMFLGTGSWDIVGIAHFIQGRNLLKLGSLSEAYLSFSRALEIPHYHDKARTFQQQVVVDIAAREATAYASSDTASLRPTNSCRGSVSSKSN